jgi:hypothetical protein
VTAGGLTVICLVAVLVESVAEVAVTLATQAAARLFVLAFTAVNVTFAPDALVVGEIEPQFVVSSVQFTLPLAASFVSVAVSAVVDVWLLSVAGMLIAVVGVTATVIGLTVICTVAVLVESVTEVAVAETTQGEVNADEAAAVKVSMPPERLIVPHVEVGMSDQVTPALAASLVSVAESVVVDE